MKTEKTSSEKMISLIRELDSSLKRIFGSESKLYYSSFDRGYVEILSSYLSSSNFIMLSHLTNRFGYVYVFTVAPALDGKELVITLEFIKR